MCQHLQIRIIGHYLLFSVLQLLHDSVRTLVDIDVLAPNGETLIPGGGDAMASGEARGRSRPLIQSVKFVFQNG